MSNSFSKLWTNFFPPKPTFTDKDVGDLAGKVRQPVPPSLAAQD
jgi:hypothetical protein